MFDYDEYLKNFDPYFPPSPYNGQGITMASQTAVTAGYLIVRYDNEGAPIWEDDCQSYADWLYQNIDGVDAVIDKMIENPDIDDREYDTLFGEMLDIVADKDLLRELNSYPANGSISDCQGPVLDAMERFENNRVL